MITIVDLVLPLLPAGVVPLVAIGVIVGAVVALVLVIIAPGRKRLPLRRRRLGAEPESGWLTRLAGASTSAAEVLLRRRGGGAGAAALLDRAGVRMRLQELVVLVAIVAVVAAGFGLLVGGPVLAIVLLIVVPVLTRVGVGLKLSRRQRVFADQLEDSLQLMSSSLRAGHSILQALNAVAREAEEPTATEYARIINEVRIGRELSDALDETATRMQSDDFSWVTQAIAINREVGGNLAEVLDRVAETIRDRNQIRRQVKALSAEGTMSAWVLMGLPLCIVGFLTVTNPAYMASFTQSLIGFILIGVAVTMLIIGGVWLRKVVTIKF